MAYLDNAATSFPKPAAVLNAVSNALRRAGNAGRGNHAQSSQASGALYECRATAARFFSAAGAEQVAFTQNATHALNIAIKGLLCNGGRAVISCYEHNSVTRPLYAMEKNGVTVSVAKARLWDDDALVRAFEKELQTPCAAVICTAVSNVFGYILPIRRIGKLCAERNVKLVIDAAQAAGCVETGMDMTGVTAICAAGHKGLYGPPGTGLLVLSEGTTLPTLLEGGTGMDSRSKMMPENPPERYEAGTQNVAGIAGLCAGLEFITRLEAGSVLRHEREMMELAAAELARLPGIILYKSPDATRQSGVMSFISSKMSSGEIADRLGQKGVAVRGGMHCSPLAHMSQGTPQGGAVRISPGIFTTEQEIMEFIFAMREII